MIFRPDPNKPPIDKLKVGEKEILKLNKDSGWEITEIIFNEWLGHKDDEVEEITVVVRKKEK